jgi:nitrogenase molybdenum-iron protein alpha/beta subunit
VCDGYETGVTALLNQLPLARGETIPRSVNLLGLSIFNRNCTGDVIELRRLMELCGITVNCALCAGDDLDSVKRLPDAELNVVIHPEYGLKAAQYLSEQFGMPYCVADGPPIGFAATEALMGEVCERLGADISRFTEDCERARARAYAFISRENSLTGLPKGVTFAVEGTYSEIYAYTSFLVRYFGMIPDCASVLNPRSDCFRDRLDGLYGGFGAADALKRDILVTNGELVFASGNTIAALKLRRHVFSGIETGLPSFGYVDVIPKTHLGVRGALMMVETVLNGMVQ